ncbi:MAG: DUF5063 domain-containing protein [Dysgonamonadaceae bacterium]|jgi:hypothetical protein|nr:DUF5063 domain-containing protein [Dysgonamonadaceae bacterium]
MKDVVLSKYTEDFVRIALEYCILMEKTRQDERKSFVDNMLKVLPLLYLKISVIPLPEEDYESDLKTRVDEKLYDSVRDTIGRLLGDDDIYLETFHPDIRLSDSPVAVKISEDMADIYQDLGNFIAVFKNGQKETMNDSLALCIRNFREFWGQRLVNALRAFHYIRYKEEILTESE